jgi:hypothetical protein
MFVINKHEFVIGQAKKQLHLDQFAAKVSDY